MARFALAVVSVALLWGAEQVWREHAKAVAQAAQQQPGLMLSAIGIQILAGIAAGFAVTGSVRLGTYRTSRAVAVGLLPLLMIALLFMVFGLGVSPAIGGAIGKVLELSSQIIPGLGILVGLGVVAGFESQPTVSPDHGT